MATMARTERRLLCDVALQLGESEPTLCEGWDVKDLVVHLLVREGSPAAVGVVVPPLSGLTERASRRLGARDFTVLVERLRKGPPRYSPFALPKADDLLNTLELFVHHEDIRRAQEGWTPRQLSAAEETRLWKAIRVVGKAPVRDAPVGVQLERSDTGERVQLKPGAPTVTVCGLPSEVSLFVFGRKKHARVELQGADEDVAALRGSALSV